MSYKYFKGCDNIDDVKIKYRKYAKELHPDISNNNGDFNNITSEYNDIKEKIKAGYNIFPIRDIDRSGSYSSYSYDYKEKEGSVSVKSLIQALEVSRKKNNYKKYWVYYNLLEIADAQNFILDYSHFSYLGEILSYKPEWARIKYSEYLENISQDK